MDKSSTVKVREKIMGPATRDAYGKALVELGKTNKDIVVLDADLSKSTKTEAFGKAYPDRFFDIGIQEANMVGLASGLAASGKIPFISSFACFLTCKGYDQLRMTVAFPQENVKVVASHGGISVGEDGVSQQSIEDFALMASLPHFVVMCPCDDKSTTALVRKAAEHEGPVYMRTCRPKAPVVYTEDQPFEIGKGIVLSEGKDVTLLSYGLMVYESLVAADRLLAKGIRATVVDIHTLKPLDADLITDCARKTGAVVTAEEHSIYGGLASMVAVTLAKTHPVPQEIVALKDTYAESGPPDKLLIKYGLSSDNIVRAAERAVARKR